MDTEPTGTKDPKPLRSLYVCYMSLEDPLVHTQVVAYLAGLSKLGHTVHLLTFETAQTSRRRRELRAALAEHGITWHRLRYHKRPTLIATTLDVVCGSIFASWLIRRYTLDAFHARNHVPAAMALLARRLACFRLIFDVRGLMAEEYEDAGRWRRDSLPFRITKTVERRALHRAAALVVLTTRVRDYLFGEEGGENVYVIPCCADVDRIEAARMRRAQMRSRLGLDGRTVLVYVGKFTGWYMERQMVEFFAVARESRPNLHFLILTQGDPKPIEREFARLGIDRSSWTITRTEPSHVGEHLSAADAAIAFIRPSFSKISSSPTKIGEYLAAGLPMIFISGVGDVDELIRSYRVGVGLDTWDRPEFKRGFEDLCKLMLNDEVADRARIAARERLSLNGVGIPAYDAVYRAIRGC